MDLAFEEWLDIAEQRVHRIEGATSICFTEQNPIWRELYDGKYTPEDAADEVVDDYYR